MEQLLKLTGRIEVFPKDRSRLKKKKKPNEEQTIIVKINNDFSHYYASFLGKSLGVLLEPPPFGSHITVNNGIEPIKNLAQHAEFLKQINGKIITVEYSPEIYRHWEFFATPVYSKELNNIRETLGLKPKSSFHVTLGRVHPHAKKQSVLTRVLV